MAQVLVSPNAKHGIAERVSDEPLTPTFDTLADMRMMLNHEVGTLLYEPS